MPPFSGLCTFGPGLWRPGCLRAKGQLICATRNKEERKRGREPLSPGSLNFEEYTETNGTTTSARVSLPGGRGSL